MFTKPLPEPWLGFLTDLDKGLPEPMTLLCMGGFVMTHCYGCPRTTVDIDTCGLAPWADRGSSVSLPAVAQNCIKSTVCIWST